MSLRRRQVARKEVFLSVELPASNSSVQLRSAVIVGLALVGLPSVARAERALEVSAVGTPFTPAELTAALRMRLPIAGPPLAIAVTPAEAGRVTVAIGGATHEVDLAGREGSDAARLVALAVVDLAEDDLAVLPAAPVVVKRVALVRASTTAIELGLFGSARAWQGTLAGATFDLTAVRDSGWLVALEVAGDKRVTGNLDFAGAVVRASGGVRSGAIELRGGIAIAPTWERDGAGDQTTMFGAAASARAFVRVAPSVTFAMVVGLDAYTTRTTYQLGMASYTTPWVAPWLAVGMEVAP